jgi:hypothetical protein
MSKKGKASLQVEITTEAQWEKFLDEDGMKGGWLVRALC